MNKKLIAFTLVLLIAVGGLFAAIEGVTSSANVTATLSGVIGTTFSHGFTTADGMYQSSATNEGDAFSTDPELIYGFKVKYGTGFTSMMTVGSFKNGTEEVDINEVIIQVTDKTDVSYTGASLSTAMKVLEYTATNTLDIQEATIIIVPGSIDGKALGNYTSTLSISIETD